MAKTPNRSYFGLGIIKGYASDSAYLTATGSTPQQGDFYYNTTKPGIRYYDGTNWRSAQSSDTRAIVRLFDDTLTATPSGPQTIDGESAIAGDLVVLGNHSTTKGIYQVDAGTWILVSDILSDISGAPVEGEQIFIQEGSNYAGKQLLYFSGAWSSLELSPGIQLNSTLRWNGTGWVENQDVLTSANSIFTKDENTNDASAAQGLDFKAGNKTNGTGNGGTATVSGGDSVGGAGGNAVVAGGSGATEDGDVILSGTRVQVLAQAATDPAGVLGAYYYNTAENRFKYYDGTNWRPMGSGGGAYVVDYAETSATTISTSDPYSPDGTAVIVGDQVLFTNLTTLTDRGVWEVTDITLGTITWAKKVHGQDPAGDSFDGDFVWVKSGSSNADKLFVCDDTATANWVDYASSSGGVIGAAEDADYTDGLFTDFVPTTPIGTAIDRFNEILKALAPPPAPTISSMSFATSAGPQAKLSWGTGNSILSYANVTTSGGGSAVNENGTFVNTGNRKGAYAAATTSWSGVLANNVSAGPGSPNPAYPANSFGDADQGFLRLYVNGVQVHQVDLSTFGSGSSLNGNGSGFTGLSAATSIVFPDGTPLPLFKYRTGSWVVNAADCQLGHNYFQVEHYISGSSVTQKYDLVRDTNAVALSAASGSLGSLSMTGSKYISGVNYHTGGTAQYGVTISNAYRNLYSAGTGQITFVGSGCTVPAVNIPNMTTEADNITLSGQVATINVNRLLNAAISVGVSITHPLKAGLTNQQNQAISGLLLDSVATTSTDVIEHFEAENIRMASTALGTTNNYAAQADVTNVSNAWDSTQDIISGSSGHQNGLLYEGGVAKYPTQGANGGNYSTITNGQATVNYSGATGDRHFYVKFRNNSGATKSNFKINIAGASSSFVSAGTALSSNNLHVEMKFPQGGISTATGWMDCYDDFSTGDWNDGDGARLAAQGAGRDLATDWGLTIGTKSIAANEYIIMRVTASSSWTGNLSQITLTWL